MKITGTLASELLPLGTREGSRFKRRLFEKIINAITDSDPEASFSGSARDPFPFFPNPFSVHTLSPGEKWKRIRKASVGWPTDVQRASKSLLSSDQLPDWTRIRRCVRRMGFDPVPVKSRVDEPTYSYLVSTGRIPVFTRWGLHYRRMPHYATVLDTFHDLGHVFALGKTDYRDYFEKFAALVLKSKPQLALSPRLSSFYKRHFEYAVALLADGTAEPVGAVPFTLQTVFFKGASLWPIAQDRSKLARVHRPFRSRAEWRDSVESFLSEFG